MGRTLLKWMVGSHRCLPIGFSYRGWLSLSRMCGGFGVFRCHLDGFIFFCWFERADWSQMPIVPRGVPVLMLGALSLCDFPSEDVLHELRDCSQATSPWKEIIPNHNCSSFFCLNLTDCLLENLSIKERYNRSFVIFATALCRICTSRCSFFCV